MKKNPIMITEMTLQEFRDSGLLWYINMQLHLFGAAIGIESQEDGSKELKIYKTRFRGFPEDRNTLGYKQLTDYLKNNMERLEEAVNEEF